MLEQRQKTLQQLQRCRGTPADVKIDRNDGIDAAGDGVAAGKHAAVPRAIADRDHPFRVRRRVVGALQGLAHIVGDRAGDEQHVGMARRGDEAQAEALEVVEGVVESMDFQFATIAGSGVDFADGRLRPSRRRAARSTRRRIRRATRRRRGGASVSGRRTRLSNRVLRMRCLLEIVPRIGAVERFVAERKVGDDVAFDRSFKQRPLKPGGIAQVAARDAVVEPQPDEHVASETLDESMPSRGSVRASTADRDRPVRQPRKSARSVRLCSTSRMRTQTRAFTSPASNTGTLKSSSS